MSSMAQLHYFCFIASKLSLFFQVCQAWLNFTTFVLLHLNCLFSFRYVKHGSTSLWLLTELIVFVCHSEIFVLLWLQLILTKVLSHARVKMTRMRMKILDDCTEGDPE